MVGSTNASSNPLRIPFCVLVVLIAYDFYNIFASSAYKDLDKFSIIRIAAFLPFLVSFLLQSRYAWHAFAYPIFFLLPLYWLLRFIGIYPMPQSTTAAIIVIGIWFCCLIYVWLLKSKYLNFLNNQHVSKIKDKR